MAFSLGEISSKTLWVLTLDALASCCACIVYFSVCECDASIHSRFHTPTHAPRRFNSRLTSASTISIPLPSFLSFSLNRVRGSCPALYQHLSTYNSTPLRIERTPRGQSALEALNLRFRLPQGRPKHRRDALISRVFRRL
ncbi:hypothetical protein HDK77DRAFT_32299 [Phyllosticta capitalensis]|uniref:Secreted protein n=1 Tax=Phyllosticta capitalensis TaxID=121624 RepID=A0ABR1Z0G5_9PEZI